MIDTEYETVEGYYVVWKNNASCYSTKNGAINALTLLVGRPEGHPACKTEWRGAGFVICLERDGDLHTAQLMPLLLTVSCFSKTQIGFTFLVPAHPGCPGKWAVKRVCVCVLFNKEMNICEIAMLHHRLLSELVVLLCWG